ncbi:hypothetical protein ABW20_dc0101870 [Dactylellina cionopaga]|nr:hypothetical protein ABW20_dc0101870 [Dactylellina cionopaga]
MPPRAQGSSAEEWGKYRVYVQELYLKQRLTQEEICERLQKHGFNVKPRQLVHRLKLWGITKNTKEVQYWEAVQATADRLKQSPDKPKEILVKGILLSDQKLKKAYQRYGWQNPELVARMTGEQVPSQSTNY